MPCVSRDDRRLQVLKRMRLMEMTAHLFAHSHTLFGILFTDDRPVGIFGVSGSLEFSPVPLFPSFSSIPKCKLDGKQIGKTKKRSYLH